MGTTAPLTAGRNVCALCAVDRRRARCKKCFMRPRISGRDRAPSKRTKAGRANIIQFGRRPIPPRACVIEDKTHVRMFLAEMLDELGFIAREAFAGDVKTVLAEFLPDLIVLGPLGGGVEIR